MTVNTSNKRIEYSGNGSTTVFAYNFRILDETHLEVILVNSGGVETVQTLTTHYTVAGAGDAGGGDVTMVTAPASGESLVLRRKMPFTQDIDYVSGDPFPAETHERGIDERVMEAQELIEITDRALKAPKQDSAIGDMPAAAARIGKLLTFGTTGDPEATAYTNSQLQAAVNVAAVSDGSVQGLDKKPYFFQTVATAQEVSYLQTGDVVVIGERAEHAFDVSASGTANGYDVISLTASGLYATLRVGSVTNVKALGAVAYNGVTVNYPHIAAALAITDTVLIPDPGTANWYGIGDGTIELGDRQTLLFEGSARIIRASSLSADTGPVVWMKGNNCALIGNNLGGGIRSQVETPDGVVLLGAQSMAVATNNMFHCIIENISVQGHQSGGNTSGSPTHGIKAHAPSLGGAFECYFNKVRNVKVDNVNYGISLFGFANAWMLSDIWGQNTGNDHTGIGGALVWLNGAQETNISSMFLHTAPGSVGLKLSVLDNTANGGTIHTPRFTSARGITAEPGGNTRTLKVTDRVTNNYFEIQRNTTLGNELPSEFYEDNNVLVDRGYFAKFANILDNQVHLTQHKDQEATTRCFTDTAYISSVAAGATHEVLNVEVTTGAHIEISYFASGNAGAARSSGKVEYIAEDTSGVTCTAVYSRYTGTVKPCTPQVSGDVVSIPFKADYAGTSAALSVHVKVTSSIAPTVNRTYTAAGSAGTALSASI